MKLHQKLFSILLRENHINTGKPYFSAQGLVVKLFGDNCIYLPSSEYVPGLLYAFLSTARRANPQQGLELAQRRLTCRGRDETKALRSPAPLTRSGEGQGRISGKRQDVGVCTVPVTLSCWGREVMTALQKSRSAPVQGAHLGLPHRAALSLEGATLAVRCDVSGRGSQRGRCHSVSPLPFNLWVYCLPQW